uniref:Reverse transcriptase Ty1/copia-type domain-containing protein n=1 Tax=Lactuca sativa TaxID=4236 RepID=A0A9R1VDW5_LACSA|nr:hypothetical protein LSAT_V11C500243740 [Lactuca sativa]
MLSLMKKHLHLYLDQGTWFINLPARVLLKFKMVLVVQVLNLGKAPELEKLRTRNETIYQHQYCFNIEEDPKTFSEAMAFRDVHFWKEGIHDEIDSIKHNNTWVLADLPPDCKALGCKWILKRKMKVYGTIDKYKARLVI